MNLFIYMLNMQGGKESKAEIHFLNGKVSQIVLKDKGQGLEPSKRKDFEEFVIVYAEEIVEKWVDYFVKKKSISTKIVTKKVKNVRNTR